MSANATLQTRTFDAWRPRCAAPSAALGRHYDEGDTRLAELRFDPSPAADQLWELLLSENDRLAEARRQGFKLVGTMKDLGTVPVMAYALPDVVAFYPDGAWWTPCLMRQTDGLFALADALGIDASFCPVRAMLGAFVNGKHFPLPDLLTCSVGAVCDDFSAIAQRVEGLGHPILWWEMPYRRAPEPGEPAVALPGGGVAPASQADLVAAELARLREALAALSGHALTDAMLSQGIRAANQIRATLRALRDTVFLAPRSPLPALELLIAEMLIIHFCSDRQAAEQVLSALQAETRRRVAAGQGYGREDAVRLFWVNPVADLRAMQWVEACGARLCGTDFLFTHALDPIPEDLPPLAALARSALADPMVGPAHQRAARIVGEMRRLGSEALVISRIPGASHCAHEGAQIAALVSQQLKVPCVELEIPTLADPLSAALRTRLEALIETARAARVIRSGAPSRSGRRGKPRRSQEILIETARAARSSL
jgi:benzoyl-CoA reductase/2-hydroxyglutaryl-CoA dehydratase subunit BcrC/BadD/HgdB